MDEVSVHVRPAGDGWLVDVVGEVEPLVFRSGGRAEAQAHAFARTLASTGTAAQVLVHDRSLRVVGTTTYPSAAENV